MEVLQGFLLLSAGWLAVLFAILVAAFLYVRATRGEDVDLATGATAYTVLVIAASAITFTAGVAYLLRAGFGAVDSDYT